MANTDIFSTDNFNPLRSEIPDFNNFNSVNPSLNFSNYSNVLPSQSETMTEEYQPGLNFNNQPGDLYFPEDITQEELQRNQPNTIPINFDSNNMFPSEVLPEELGKANPYEFEPFDPKENLSDVFNPLRDELGYTPTDYEMIDFDPNKNNLTDTMSENQDQKELLTYLDSTPTISSFEETGINRRIDQLNAKTDDQNKKISSLEYSKGTAVTPSSGKITNQTTPINASIGYEGDIRSFFEEIKNPPRWRVLGN